MSSTLARQIYEDLRCEIESGQLNKNRFITETQIAERYHVSKAPVKAALKQLCQEAFLTSYPRKGYLINILSPEEYAELRYVRKHYEKLSVILAIENASDSDIESLRNISSSDYASKTVNTQFHIRLAAIGGNSYHAEVISRLMNFQLLLPMSEADVDTPHERIIAALLERDCEKALQLLDEDLQE